MLKVDALYALLFLEFAAFCIVLSLFLFCRNRKHKQLYRKALSDIVSLKSVSTTDTSQKHAGPSGGGGATAEKTVGNAKYEELLKEKGLLTGKVDELTAQLESENKRMSALQSKYATLEKEYSVLYGKHFEGKEKSKPA